MNDAVIFLVRHGMHEWLRPDRSRLAGALPGIGLNEQGIREARHLAILLAGEPLAWVVSSPLQRTRETAEIIARDHGLTVRTDDRLIEWRFGPWEGMAIEEIRRQYPMEWEAWRERPDHLHLPGAELLEQVADRMGAAYREWAARREVGVLVSHQDPLAALLFRLLGAPLSGMRALEIATGSLSKCRETPYGTVVAGVNLGAAFT